MVSPSREPTDGGREASELEAVLEALDFPLAYVPHYPETKDNLPIPDIFQRYPHRKRRANTNSTLEPYCPSHNGGQLGADTKAQPGTAKLLAQTKITLDKRLKDLLLHVLRNTRTGILDLELKHVRLGIWRWRRRRPFSDLNMGCRLAVHGVDRKRGTTALVLIRRVRCAALGRLRVPRSRTHPMTRPTWTMRVLRERRCPTFVLGLLDLANAAYPELDPSTCRGKLETVADKVDNDLKNTMLVAPETHILKAADAGGSECGKSLFDAGAPLGAALEEVGADETDGEGDFVLANLLVKDGQHLGSYLTKSELSFFQADLLADLVFGEAEEILQQMQQKIA